MIRHQNQLRMPFTNLEEHKSFSDFLKNILESKKSVSEKKKNVTDLNVIVTILSHSKALATLGTRLH